MRRKTPAPASQTPLRARRMPPDELAHAAATHLASADRRFARIIGNVGVHRPVIQSRPFVALIESITQQQVSLASAAAVFRRLRLACPGGRLTPAAVLQLNDVALRGAGLSRQKSQYVRNVAEAFASGRLNSAKLRRMDDEAVVTEVAAIKGVGRWTVEMLLIFCLGRPDVWPVDDLGLRRSLQRFLGLPEPLPATDMRTVAEPWRPYRTYAAWYLWRFSEGNGQPGVAVSTK